MKGIEKCQHCGIGGLHPTLKSWITIAESNYKKHYPKESLWLTSGARCAEHNEAVGGSKGSLHLVSKEKPHSLAADINCEHLLELWIIFEGLKFASGMGFYAKERIIHVDISPNRKARWIKARRRYAYIR